MLATTQKRSGVSRESAPVGISSAVNGVSMYADEPNEEVTLEDFEIWAFERLKGEEECLPTAHSEAAP